MSDWQAEALAELEHARGVLAREAKHLIILVPVVDLFGGVKPIIKYGRFMVAWDAKEGVIPNRQTVTVNIDGYGEVEVTCVAEEIYHKMDRDGHRRVTYTAVIKTNSSKEG